MSLILSHIPKINIFYTKNMRIIAFSWMQRAECLNRSFCSFFVKSRYGFLTFDNYQNFNHNILESSE